MAYLVTGGTGFIGSYVVRDLISAGKEAVCLQRSGVTNVFRGVVGEDKVNTVKIVQGDISNTLALFDVIAKHKIDTIIHAGFLLHSGGSDLNPAYALQVNCVGMSNLLEAARLLGLRKIIWTSSSQALGRIGEFYKGTIGDDAIYMPDSMYSATKMLDEFMCKLYFDRFDVDSIGLRIGFVIGVEKILGRGVFARFLKDAATDKTVTMATTDSDKMRPLCYVENISDLIVKACDAPPTKTRTFNAVEYLISCRQLAESIRKVNPKTKVIIKDGVKSEEATWVGTPEPMLDTNAIRTELGWKPKYTLEEALAKIFNYFRKQEGLTLL